MTLFILLGLAMTLLTAALILWPLLRDASNRAPIAAAMLALVLPGAVLLTYLAASNYDWASPPAPATAEAGAAQAAAEGPLAEAIRGLEERLRENPDDLEGWLLLGSSYTATGRPAEALPAFRRALELSGGTNPDARLGVAEAQLLLEPDAIAGEAGETIEQVLTEVPRNPKALWYGGLIAVMRGEPALVRQRWETLLELEPPMRVREIVEQELARLGAMQAAADGDAGSAESTSASVASIAVSVSLADELAANVQQDAPLFVFVRDGNSPGPPVAVVRRSARELPLELVISDADGMMPGRSLAALRSAEIVARVANGGDPLPQPGDLYGSTRWSVDANGRETVSVVIDQQVR